MPPDIRENNSHAPEVPAPLKGSEISATWIHYKNSYDQKVRNQLIQYYLPLVHYEAESLGKRLCNRNDTEDLRSAGVFGLIGAIDAYDLARGVSFESYCLPRIRGSMLDERRKADWVPRIIRSVERKLGATRTMLTAILRRKPSDEEMSYEIGVDTAEYEKLQQEATIPQFQSLAEEIWTTNSKKKLSQVASFVDLKTPMPDERMEQADSFRTLLRGLSQQERLMIILYYQEGFSWKEISEHLGVSPSRVSQVHSEIKHHVHIRFEDVRTCEERIHCARYMEEVSFDDIVEKLLATIMNNPSSGHQTVIRQPLSA